MPGWKSEWNDEMRCPVSLRRSAFAGLAAGPATGAGLVLTLTLLIAAGGCDRGKGATAGVEQGAARQEAQQGKSAVASAAATPGTAATPGAADSRSGRAVDEPNKLPGACTEEVWRAGSGVVSRTFFTYDAQGRLIQEEEDGGFAPADGDTDFLTTYTYDSAGLLLRKELDVGVNGSINKTQTNQHDAKGRLIKEEIDWLGGLPDGKVDMWTTHRYDEAGNELVEEVDGTEPGMRSRTIFIYDAQGRLTRKERDHQADGSSEAFWVYTYDAEGRLLREEEETSLGDSSTGGVKRLAKMNHYDGRGNLVLQEIDLHLDGQVDYREESRYDDAGHLLEKTVKDAAGELQMRVTSSYDCWKPGAPARQPAR